MTGERSATAAAPTRVFPSVEAAGPPAALSIVLVISGCGLIVGDPDIGRGSIEGIEGSAPMVSAMFVSPDGDKACGSTWGRPNCSMTGWQSRRKGTNWWPTTTTETSGSRSAFDICCS